MTKQMVLSALFLIAGFTSNSYASDTQFFVPDFIAPSVVSTEDVSSPAVGQIIYDMSTQSFKGRPADSNTWRELSKQTLVFDKASATMTGPTTAYFIAFSGNTNVVNLTPGLWRLGGAVSYSGGLVEGLVSARWAAGPGANSATSPTPFPTTNASLDAGSYSVNYTVATSSSSFPVQTVYVRITGAAGSKLPIYLVPIVNAANSLASVAVSVTLFAERVQE